MQPSRGRRRLVGMRGVSWLAAVLALAAGCAGSAPEVACPAIGVRAGIGVSVPSGVLRVTLEACWHGQCVTHPVGLLPDSFVDLPGLPAEPVRVTVRFDDRKPYTTYVTPTFVQPGGPPCGNAGPQAQLHVPK